MTRQGTPALLALPIDAASVVVRARRHASDVAEALGLDVHRRARVATAVSEIVRNAWEHARDGRVRFELDGEPVSRLVVHVDDAGDGIARLHERIGADDATRPGPTHGLEVARRLADRFEVATGSGGTRATLTFEVAPSDRGVAPAALDAARALDLPRSGARGSDATSDEAVAEELRGLREHVALLTDSLVEARTAVTVRDETLAIVTHDLRSPLGAIVSNAELLGFVDVADPDAPATIADTGAAVLRSARQMDKLIADLLDLAALREGRLAVDPAPEDAAELVAACAREHERVAARLGLDLAHGGAPGLTLRCDRDRVLQVLSNLVGNAMKFTEAGGRIALDVRRVGDAARFSVLDTGRGMTGDELGRMFERHWQRDGSDRRGIGLGLSIVRALVDAHGGSIDVESESGTGTRVRVDLPLAGP